MRDRSQMKEVTLDSFLGEEREAEEKVKEGRVSGADKGLKEVLYSMITKRGKIPKSELYKYMKERGIKPAEFYKALKSLEEEGLIRRVFDGGLKELTYTTA